MKRIFCILLLLCLYFYGFGQSKAPSHKALSLGDTMPDLLLNGLKNFKDNSLQFSDFQKELTIIDFWATWCGACVGSFDKMHHLQQQFAKQLQVLMVNVSPKEDAAKVENFFTLRKKRTGKDFTLAYTLQDTIFSTRFPYKVIPHCLWLDKNRKVIAITESEAVTEANIAAVLAGQPVSLPFKNDALLFDAAKDTLHATDGDASAASLLQQSFISCERPGLGSKVMYESVNATQVKRLRILNYSLLPLYQIAFGEAFNWGAGRIDTDSFARDVLQQDLATKQRSRYCYELFSRPMSRQQALQHLATDLERYFDVTAVADRKCLPVFLLKGGNNMQSLYSRTDISSSDLEGETLAPFITNGTMEELAGFLKNVLKKPVVNETGLVQTIDIRFPTGFQNYTPLQVKNFLHSQGILLEEAERLLPVTRLQRLNN